jgi:hypothetical protein
MLRQYRISWSSRVCALGSAFLLMSSSGCTAIQPAVIVEPGASFTLAPGQTATVRGTDTRITFKEVREDSRCPIDVTCVWAGDAKIEIAIDPNGPASPRILSITPPNNETRVGNLRIRFVGLTPVPRQADGNVPRNYLAEFVAEQG